MVASLTNQKDSLIGLADDFGGGDIVIEWNYIEFLKCSKLMRLDKHKIGWYQIRLNLPGCYGSYYPHSVQPNEIRNGTRF